MIEFYKYQGAGNDFIMIDNRKAVFTGDKVAFVRRWCERRFGIGSDGMIFIEADGEADFTMDFYNPDGSQSFCGNGSRCAMAFASFLGFIGNKAVFKAIDGMHEGELTSNGVRIKMGNVTEVKEIGKDHFIHTGSPHYISWCEADDKRDIVEFGKQIRYSEPYRAEGTNVNLIRPVGDSHIDVRTYERGVENETFACGTGATACGLSYAYLNGLKEGKVRVDVRGGELSIYLKQPTKGMFEEVWLEGPAAFVFKGEING